MKKAIITVRLNNEDLRHIKLRAKDKNISISDYIRNLIKSDKGIDCEIIKYNVLLRIKNYIDEEIKKAVYR